MSLSGKIFQFNIGSAISFQFRAGFASISYDKSRSGNRQDPQQVEKLEESRKLVEARQRGQSDFYEVVGSYANESSVPAQRVYPAMIALPERAVERAALMPTESSSGSSGAARAYRRETEARRELANRKSEYIEYIQGYNRHGQKVVGMLELPTIDFVI